MQPVLVADGFHIDVVFGTGSDVCAGLLLSLRSRSTHERVGLMTVSAKGAGFDGVKVGFLFLSDVAHLALFLLLLRLQRSLTGVDILPDDLHVSLHLTSDAKHFELHSTRRIISILLLVFIQYVDRRRAQAWVTVCWGDVQRYCSPVSLSL